MVYLVYSLGFLALLPPLPPCSPLGASPNKPLAYRFLAQGRLLGEARLRPPPLIFTLTARREMSLQRAVDPKGGGSHFEVPAKPGLLCAMGAILAYLLCKHFTGKRRSSIGSLGTCSGWRKKHSESSKEKNHVPKARCNLVRPAWGLEPFVF